MNKSRIQNYIDMFYSAPIQRPAHKIKITISSVSLKLDWLFGAPQLDTPFLWVFDIPPIFLTCAFEHVANFLQEVAAALRLRVGFGDLDQDGATRLFVYLIRIFLECLCFLLIPLATEQTIPVFLTLENWQQQDV